MLAKRIMPCLDVRDGVVVKGVQFQQHRIIGDPIQLAAYYEAEGADELVFYDIRASCDEREVTPNWVNQVAAQLSIPFTVAGGIRHIDTARRILHAGADKISVNSPALENPGLIDALSREFGSQCVVVGVDSQWVLGEYAVFQYTGDIRKTQYTQRKTLEWVREVEARGAGEIVLNCMQQDGMRAGYDIEQLRQVRALTSIPLIASGGAGDVDDFTAVFRDAGVDGALAASVFHDRKLRIQTVKQGLMQQQIKVR
jgi:cyclase